MPQALTLQHDQAAVHAPARFRASWARCGAWSGWGQAALLILTLIEARAPSLRAPGEPQALYDQFAVGKRPYSFCCAA